MNKYILIYKWWGDEEIYHEFIEAASELDAYKQCEMIQDLLYDWVEETPRYVSSIEEVEELIFKTEMTFKCIKV